METYGIAAVRRLNLRLYLSKTAIGGSHRKKINDDTARHKSTAMER